MMLKTEQFVQLSKCLCRFHFSIIRNRFTLISRGYTSDVRNRSTESITNIFSDQNKHSVISRMKNAKPITRPVKDIAKDREAAVLVPMCHVNGEPALLFMMRSRYLKNHRGEISFPGGKKDSSDRDLVHTALRETFEEIGLAESSVDVWGTMPPVPSMKSGMVTPVLGYCGSLSEEQLNLNKSEVEEVFFRTVSSLCDPANQRRTQWRYPGNQGYTLPVFLGEEHRIWGLTAIFIHQVLNLLAPDMYKFKLKHHR